MGKGSIVYFVSTQALFSYFDSMVSENGGSYKLVGGMDAPVYECAGYAQSKDSNHVLENDI